MLMTGAVLDDACGGEKIGSETAFNKQEQIRRTLEHKEDKDSSMLLVNGILFRFGGLI